MKKVVIAIMMLLTLAVGGQAASQKHRHTPQEELVDSAQKNAVEVYSDTTGVVDQQEADDEWSEEQDRQVMTGIDRLFSSVDKNTEGLLFILAVLFIIFVLSPVLIIVVLFYFIRKNRKDKMRLAQMAMQNGQPIPEKLLEDKVNNVTEEYQRGMRQCFVGVGLMIFLGYAAGTVGFGIGALVFCIGLGKVFASKTANRRVQDDRDLNSQNRRGNNDDLTQNNYD